MTRPWVLLSPPDADAALNQIGDLGVVAPRHDLQPSRPYSRRGATRRWCDASWTAMPFAPRRGMLRAALPWTMQLPTATPRSP